MASFHLELLDAISRLSLARVKEYVGNGGELDNWDYNGMTPLHFAIQNYDREREDSFLDDIIVYLIDNGAMVNAIHGLNGMNATMFAMTRKVKDELVMKFINAGTDLNYAAPIDQEKTTLAYAMENGYGITVISELLNRGANPDCRLQGETPLFHAVHNRNDPELVALFLNAEADTVLLGPNYFPFIAKCCQTNCKIDEVCRYKRVIDIMIRRGYDITGKINEIDDTLIHLTTCTYLIHLVVRAGVSINEQNRYKFTPLHDVLYIKNMEKVNNLLLMGANPNCDSPVHFRPLHWLWVLIDPQFHKLLLFHGADLLVHHFYDGTPIDRIFSQNNVYTNEMYDPGMKMIIKHFMLFYNECSFDDRIREFVCEDRQKYFLHFTASCRGELSIMHNKMLKANLSIFSFLHMRRYYRTEVVPIEMKELIVDYESISTDFPNYKDLILMRLKDNFSKYFRRKLINQIEKISIWKPVEDGPKDEVVLIYDCLYLVVKNYLSYRQLYALLLASLNN